jgi:hypothetical protein
MGTIVLTKATVISINAQLIPSMNSIISMPR